MSTGQIELAKNDRKVQKEEKLDTMRQHLTNAIYQLGQNIQRWFLLDQSSKGRHFFK